jgi:hypothetical protein
MYKPFFVDTNYFVSATDLLIMNPFREIEILEPARFLLDFKNLIK